MGVLSIRPLPCHLQFCMRAHHPLLPCLQHADLPGPQQPGQALHHPPSEDATEQQLQWDLSEPSPAGDELDWLQQAQPQGQHLLPWPSKSATLPQPQGEHQLPWHSQVEPPPGRAALPAAVIGSGAGPAQLPWLAEVEGHDQAETQAGAGFLSEPSHDPGGIDSQEPSAADQAASPAAVGQHWQAEDASQGEPVQEVAQRSGRLDGGPNTEGQSLKPWLRPDQPVLAAAEPGSELSSGHGQLEQGHGEHQGAEQRAADGGHFWALPEADPAGLQGQSTGGTPRMPDWPEHEIPLHGDAPHQQPSGAAGGAAGQPVWPEQQQPGQEGPVPGPPDAHSSWAQQAEGAWRGPQVQGQEHLPAGSDAHSWGQWAEGTSSSWQQPQQPANPWAAQGTPSQQYAGWDGSSHQRGHDSQQGSQALHTPFAQYPLAAAGLGWDQHGAAQPAASLYGYPTTVDTAVRSPDGRPPIALMALGFAGRSLLWQSSTVLSESAGPCMGSWCCHIRLGHSQLCSSCSLTAVFRRRTVASWAAASPFLDDWKRERLH